MNYYDEFSWSLSGADVVKLHVQQSYFSTSVKVMTYWSGHTSHISSRFN